MGAAEQRSERDPPPGAHRHARPEVGPHPVGEPRGIQLHVGRAVDDNVPLRGEDGYGAARSSRGLPGRRGKWCRIGRRQTACRLVRTSARRRRPDRSQRLRPIRRWPRGTPCLRTGSRRTGGLADRSKLFRQFLELLHVARTNGHARPGVRERNGACASDAAACAGDECSSICHGA